MRKFVIEREMPGVGGLSDEEIAGASATSCRVLEELGPRIQWVQSYVTGDKIYCVYLAEREELIRVHAEKAGFPANRVSEVVRVIDPTTASVA